jgi:hypothetical protein
MPAENFGGYQWMSPSGFSQPAAGHFGNCPAQGPVNGPGYFDADIGLMKNFHFTEATYVQFRTDFLNAFNNVNLYHPNNGWSASPGTFGQINVSEPARNIQFALKMYF